MKFCGIVGSAEENSATEKLLTFVKRHFSDDFELDIVEIKDVPLFNESNDQTDSPVIQDIVQRIDAADGVIIATPEINFSIPAALKSLIEWLSFNVHPLAEKPVMIIGDSKSEQGSSRSQLHLLQVLDSPGVNALVLPGNEFLLSYEDRAFDENGDLVDEGTINFLGQCLDAFKKFTKVAAQLKESIAE